VATEVTVSSSMIASESTQSQSQSINQSPTGMHHIKDDVFIVLTLTVSEMSQGQL
jgi:hypothetical protein